MTLTYATSLRTGPSSIAALQSLKITPAEPHNGQTGGQTGGQTDAQPHAQNGARTPFPRLQAGTNPASDVAASLNVTSALDAATASLQRAQSTVDVAVAAGKAISELLIQIRSRTLEASAPSVDATSLEALSSDVAALVDQITHTVAQAEFKGVNLLSGTTAQLPTITDVTASGMLTLTAEDLTVGGARLGDLGAVFTSHDSAGAYLTLVNTAIANTSSAVTALVMTCNAVAARLTFIDKLQETLNESVAALVDADVAKESANLTALKARQQLGGRALAMTRAAKFSLLHLVR